MPKAPAIPHDQLRDIIMKFDVVDSTGKVLGPTHEVWAEIEKSTEGKLLGNYIYVYVKGNRYGVLDAVLKAKGIEPVLFEKDEEDIYLDAAVNNISQEPVAPSQSLRTKCTFRVIIPPDKWTEMKPRKIFTERKDRPSRRCKLALPGYIWEPILIDCFWMQYKIPCPYTFLLGSVYTSQTSEHFIEIDAKCKECGATAKGFILEEPAENESAILEWTANDTRGLPHVTKRPLSHELRKKTGRDIQGQSAAAYRKKEAARLMSHGDVEPPHLFHADILQDAKIEETDREYDIVSCSSDPIRNLQIMKYTHPYAGMIHQIGLDPFFLHYYSPAQLHVYKTFSSKSYIVMAIDATGSLVQKLETYSEQKSPHIFLYEGVIKAGDQQLPVLQMLSARQDTCAIQFWINEYLKQGARSPDEVVVDNSKALINGVVMTFGGCYDLRDYYCRCYQILTEPHLSETDFKILLPLTYIRLDIAHLIGGAAKWKIWKVKATKRLKTFYLMCLGLLVYETTLAGFRDTFIMICLIASSEFSSSEVTNSRSKLVQRIEGTSSELSLLTQLDETQDVAGNDDTNDPDTILETDSDEEETAEEDSVFKYIRSIKQAVASKLEERPQSDEPNAYYAPGVQSQLYYLLPDFLLWTGLMVAPFRSPTATGSSTRAESDFYTLKNCVLKDSRRLYRLDRFVAIHLKYVNGACHIAKASDVLEDYNSGRNSDEDSGQEEEIAEDGNVSSQPAKEGAQNQSDVSAKKRTNKNQSEVRTKKRTQNQSEDKANKRTKNHTKESTKNINQNGEASGNESSETDMEKSLNEFENWRGLGSPPQKSQKSKYLNACPELTVAMQADSLQPPKDRLLQNGMKRGFARTSDNSEAQLTNTCAFDVLAQILTCSYIQYGTYRNSLAFYLEDDIYVVCKSLAEKGAVPATYKLRLDTVSKIIAPTKVAGPTLSSTRSKRSCVAITYDCYDDIIDQSRKLLKNVLSVSVEYKCSQRKPCLSNCDLSIVNADMDVLYDKGIENLDVAVLVALNVMCADSAEKPADSTISINCRTPCRGTAEIKCVFGPHLLLNVDVYGSTGCHTAQRQFVKIGDVPVEMNLLGKKFLLCGIGARQSNHYIAYCRRATGLWEVFNDLFNRVTSVKANKEVQPVLIMYVPV